MKIKVFGKELFEIGRAPSGAAVLGMVNGSMKESKYLPDFEGMRDGGMQFDSSFDSLLSLQTVSTNTQNILTGNGLRKIEEKKEEKPNKTPKEVYELKMIHDEAFKLNTDPKYVDQQIVDFKDKLNLVKTEEFDMRRGTTELESILIRLENRKKYLRHKGYFEQYPYTTSSKVKDVLKENSYLKLGQIAQFVADLPPEAIKAMKGYNAACKELCGKQAVFYIIADKKDFVKTEKRRDPILLAQSPFAHVWQILGAWDKEMMLLEDL